MGSNIITNMYFPNGKYFIMVAKVLHMITRRRRQIHTPLIPKLLRSHPILIFIADQIIVQ